MSELKLGNMTFEEIVDAGGMVTFGTAGEESKYEIDVFLQPWTPEGTVMRSYPAATSFEQALKEFEGADVRKHLE